MSRYAYFVCDDLRIVVTLGKGLYKDPESPNRLTDISLFSTRGRSPTMCGVLVKLLAVCSPHPCRIAQEHDADMDIILDSYTSIGEGEELTSKEFSELVAAGDVGQIPFLREYSQD